VRDYTSEYQKWLGRAITISDKLNDKHSRAALLHNLAVQYQQRGDLSAALATYKQSLEQEEAIGDQRGTASTLAQLGTVYYQLGDLTQAEQFYMEALEISRSLQSRLGESSLLGNLGLVYRDKERYTEAEALFQQALAISREIGDRQTEARLLTNLGSVSANMAKYSEAEGLFQQALAISREIGDRRSEASLLTDLGSVSTNMARYSEAEGLFQQALAISREIGDRRSEASLLTDLGLVFENMKRYSEAEALFQQALAISREIGDRQAEAELLTNLGSISARMAKYSEAEALFQQALAISHEIGDRQIEARLCVNLGRFYSELSQGDRAQNLQRAIDYTYRALETFTQEAYPFEYATLQNNLANTYVSLVTGDKSENLERALVYYQEALRTLPPETSPLLWAGIQNNMGLAYNQRLHGDHTENLRQAIASYQQSLHVYTKESSPGDWLRVTTNLSTAYSEIGNWSEAKTQAASVLQAFHGATGDSLDAIVPWYQRLGELAIQNQDFEFATRVFSEAAYLFELRGEKVPTIIRDRITELRKQLGDDRFVIIWAEVQGILTPALAQTLQDARQLMSQEHFGKAAEKLASALEVLAGAEETSELHRQRATILFLRGLCLRKQERWEEALKDQEQSSRLFDKLKDYLGEAHTFLEMGHLFEVMNSYEDARLHYMDAYRLYRRAQDRRGMALASENLGRLEYRVRMLPQAVQDLEEAKQLFMSLGDQAKATSIESDLQDAKASLAHQTAKKNKRSESA